MSSQEFWGTNCTAQVQIQHQYSHILPSKQVELHEKCIYSCKRSFGIGEIFFFCANFKKKGLWKYSRKMDHQQLQWAPWNLTSSGSFIERLAFLASRAAHYEAWGCASVISRLGGFDGELVLIKWNLKCMLISHLRDKTQRTSKDNDVFNLSVNIRRKRADCTLYHMGSLHTKRTCHSCCNLFTLETRNFVCMSVYLVFCS